MPERVPVMLLSLNAMRGAGRRLKIVGKAIANLFPKLGPTLKKIGLDVEPEAYAASSLISSFFYGLIFFVMILGVVLYRGTIEEPYNIALASGIGMWAVMFMLHILYPGIILKKIAAKESKDLLFALREIMIDVNSGVSLFWAVKNAAGAGYRYVSQDFQWVVEQIESGTPEREALRNLALKTESEYMKRAVWQVVNALESGAALGDALSGIVETVEEYIYRDIRNYSANLNFLILIYMFAAAVVPSLGITFLVLLSAFSDFGVTIEAVMMLVAISVVIQIIMIGYMGATRPEIFGG